MSTDGGLVLKEGRKKRTVYSGEVTLVRPRSG
jgi:hypothetical protein